LLVAIVAVGGALRVAASLYDPPLHPDEYFQYLEPAWWHLRGVGSETWEWRDGIRSWVLPFYHGAWFGFLSLLGVQRGALLMNLVHLHWALINACLVPLAYRAGRAIGMRLAGDGAQQAAGDWGGLLAALLCTGFAPLVLYAGHTLSEMPSMLCLLAGLVLTDELIARASDETDNARKAALSGALLALGACLRIANGPLALLPVLWLAFSGRRRALVSLLIGAGAVALLFALVDQVTWGGFASSFIAYLRFNLIEGGAARFGTQPPSWYLSTLLNAAPFGLPLLALVTLLGLRVTWPYALSALTLLAYLSTQPHKEARFVIGLWPLLLIAAGGTLGAILARAMRAHEAREANAGQRRVALAQAAVALSVALILADAARNADQDDWLDRERLAAIDWIGGRADLTGFMLDDAYSVSGPLYGGRAPVLQYERALLESPLLSHVLVPANSSLRVESERAGFAVVHVQGRYVVLQRPGRHALDGYDSSAKQ
jgi:hypothetical protein